MFGILLPTTECFSQNHFTINSDGGGGSGTTTPPADNSNDNTTLYVVGGLLIGGIIIYALLKHKKEKPDSSDAKDKSSLLIQNNKSESFNTGVQKANDEIPVNIILGIRKETAFITERTYLLGVSVRF